MFAAAQVPAGQAAGIERLSPKDHEPKAQCIIGIAIVVCPVQRVEGGGRLVEDRDPLIMEQAQEGRRIAGGLLGHDHEPAAMQQRAENLPDGEIEGHRMEQGPDVVRPETKPMPRTREEPGYGTMLDRDAFGLSGRSRGVDDIGQIARRCLPARGGLVLRAAVEAVQRDPFSLRREEGHRRGGADDQRRVGVRDHEGETLGWIGRIERQIGGTRLQDRDQRDDQLRRARQA